MQVDPADNAAIRTTTAIVHGGNAATPAPKPAQTQFAQLSMVEDHDVDLDDSDQSQETYPFHSCGLKVFGFSDMALDQAISHLRSDIQNAVIPPLPPIRDTPSLPPSTIADFDFVAGNRGNKARQSAIVIRFKMEKHLAGTVDERWLDAIKTFLEDLGYECVWEESRNNGRSTVGFFEMSGPIIATATDNVSATTIARQSLSSSMAAAGISYTDAWRVTLTETSILGSFGVKAPSALVTAISNGTVEQDGNTLTLRAADRFLAATYLCTIGVFVGDARETAKTYKKHLRDSTRQWIHRPVSDLDKGPRYGFVRNIRLSDDGLWLLADPSCCLLAYYLCFKRSPSGFYYDFVYHINSSLKNFNRDIIISSRDRKDAQIREAQAKANGKIPTGTPMVTFGLSNGSGNSVSQQPTETVAPPTASGVTTEGQDGRSTQAASSVGSSQPTQISASATPAVAPSTTSARSVVPSAQLSVVTTPATPTTATHFDRLSMRSESGTGPSGLRNTPRTHNVSPLPEQSNKKLKGRVCTSMNDSIDHADLYQDLISQDRSVMMFLDILRRDTFHRGEYTVLQSFFLLDCISKVNRFYTSPLSRCSTTAIIRGNSSPVYDKVWRSIRMRLKRHVIVRLFLNIAEVVLSCLGNIHCDLQTSSVVQVGYRELNSLLVSCWVIVAICVIQCNRISFPKFLIRLALLCQSPAFILLSLMLLPTGRAASVSSDPTFSLLTANVRHLGTALTQKVIDIIGIILAEMPSVFVLTETTIDDGPNREFLVQLSDYTIYTTPSGQRHGSSGGLTMGVLTRIPSRQIKVDSPQFSRGLLHVVVETPELPKSSEYVSTDIIGIYAPQPRDTEGSQQFWKHVEDRLRGKSRWLALGDFNRTLLPSETTKSLHYRNVSNTKNHYIDFLNRTAGADLWHLQGEVDLHESYTYFSVPAGERSGEAEPTTKSILDRIAVGPSLPAGHIETIPKYIHASDHRPIRASIPVPAGQSGTWHNPPKSRRLIKPKLNDEAFIHFRQKLDNALEADPELLAEIASDNFLSVYTKSSLIFTAACVESFKVPRGKSAPKAHIPDRGERLMGERINLLRAAITAARQGHWEIYAQGLTARKRVLIELLEGEDGQAALPRMQKLRRNLENELRQQPLRRAWARRDKRQAGLVSTAIITGSNKKVSVNSAVRLPAVIRDPDNPINFISEPNLYIKAVRRHFEKVLQRPDPPAVDKPWMDTPSSHRFQEKSRQRPFEWPRSIEVNDLRAMMTKGNDSPSPGPDNTEKWAIKHSGRNWLGLVVRLMNYVIQSGVIEEVLKENYLVPIYKQGDATHLHHHRGIVLANCLQSLIATWFARCLQQYFWEMGFIPEEQVAVQKGMQTADMTNLLSTLDGLARLLDKVIYALKRDQRKGFDYVHGSAWKDACDFFGLSSAVYSFDRERSKRVKIRIRARGYVSEPIITDDQIKQGDPFSPAKYVIITSMMIWWIKDTMGDTGMRIQTELGRTGGVHQAADLVCLAVQMVAAMDDTILLAEKKEDLKAMTFKVESFQRAYNMETEWDKPEKTTLFLLGNTDKKRVSGKKKVSGLETEQGNISEDRGADTEGSIAQRTAVDLRLPTGRSISISPTLDKSFLRTPINDPVVQGRKIEVLVRAFIFPKPGGKHLPIPALRRIAEVSLLGAIRPRLEMHPIPPSSAANLNSIMAVKLRQYLSLPYSFKPSVVCGMFQHGGMGFPDLEKANAVAAVSQIHRQLNSFSKGIRSTSTVTHAVWQCGGSRAMRHKTHKCARPLGPMNMGDWSKQKQNPAANHLFHWEIARSYLQDLGLQILPVLEEEGDWDETITPDPKHEELHHWGNYFLPKTEWEQNTMSTIERNIREVSPTFSAEQDLIWATDGSADKARPLDVRNCALAVVGPHEFSARLKDDHATIEDAEIIAVVAAMIMDDRLRALHGVPDTIESIIYVDRRGVINAVENYRADPEYPIPPQGAARMSQRWLRETCTRLRLARLQHIQAHTGNSDAASRLNRRADELARTARTSDIVLAPPPEHMDHFALYSDEVGLAHGHLKDTISQHWDDAHRPDIFRGSKDRYEYYDQHLYLRAHSSSSLSIQLAVRSSALPTPSRKLSYNDRGKRHLLPQTCLRCSCPALEADERHIFVLCPAIINILKAAEVELHRLMTKMLKSKHIHGQEWNEEMEMIETLFRDGPKWETGKTMYWKGLLPMRFKYRTKLKPLYDGIAGLAVRIAGKIFFAYERGQGGDPLPWMGDHEDGPTGSTLELDGIEDMWSEEHIEQDI